MLGRVCCWGSAPHSLYDTQPVYLSIMVVIKQSKVLWVLYCMDHTNVGYPYDISQRQSRCWVPYHAVEYEYVVRNIETTTTFGE